MSTIEKEELEALARRVLASHGMDVVEVDTYLQKYRLLEPNTLTHQLLHEILLALELAKHLKEEFVRRGLQPLVSSEALREHYFMAIEELNISRSAKNRLQDNGVLAIHQLVEKSETDLLKLRGFGRKYLCEVKDALVDLELCLAMFPPPRPPTKRRRR